MNNFQYAFFNPSSGDRAPGSIVTKDMSVTVNCVTCLSDINAASGTTVENCFITDAGEEGKLEFEFSGDHWVVSSIEIYGYNEPKIEGGKGAFTSDNSNIVYLEAESVTEQSDYAWSTKSKDGKNKAWSMTSGTSGYGMFFGPNSEGSYTSTDIKTSNTAKMNYKIDFKATGAYNVWMLVKSQNENDDSVIFGLDNQQSQMKNDFKETNGFAWVRAGALNVDKSGEQVLTVCGREDGLVIDKIAITKTFATPENDGVVHRK